MFGCSSMNLSTICCMNGPSPPVKPFQYASSTSGPSYSPVNSGASAAPPPCAASSGVTPPPQAASARPAMTEINPRASRRRRDAPGVWAVVLIIELLGDAAGVAGGPFGQNSLQTLLVFRTPLVWFRHRVEPLWERSVTEP